MIKIVLILLFSSLVTSFSYAEDFKDCQVVEVVSAGEKNSHVLLDCEIHVDARPSCALPNFVGFDNSTVEGKNYMSMVLTAFASGAKLRGFVDGLVCSPFQNNVALLNHLRMYK